MPYPFSIQKEAIINLDNKSINYKDIINKLTEDLSKTDNTIDIKDDKVILTHCSEFSSKTSFNFLNRGEINWDKSDGRIRLIFKIYLIEHLIFFLLTITVGVYGLIDSGLSSVVMKVMALILIVVFVFGYLMPLMTLNSFVKGFIDKL